jgi:hypothetical protein
MQINSASEAEASASLARPSGMRKREAERAEGPPASPEEAAKIDDFLRRMMPTESAYSDPMRKYTD